MQAPQCRLLPFHVALGAWNMAADESMLEAAALGVASFRLYGWSQPTLSLGYFQQHEKCRADPLLHQLPWVRRPTGGEALVHHHEVTYALALPAGIPWQRHGQSWMRRMHIVLTETLHGLGVSAHPCGDEEEKKLGEVLCFLHHTPGDLLLDDAKVLGSAQRKQRGALLQHGSILLAASPFAPRLLGIRDLTGVTISSEALIPAVIDQLTHDTGWTLASGDWHDAEQRRIDELVSGKYAQQAWNCKR